jgi:dipeptide transport system permease protein
MVAETLEHKPPGTLRAFWYAFRVNRGAVIGAVVVTLVFLCAIFAPLLAPYDPLEQFRDFTKLPPIWSEGGNWKFPLGTDPLGRDMLSRLLFGSRISLFIGLSIMVVCAFLGTCLAMLAAFMGGVVDIVILRFMDLILAIPDLVLAILIIAVIGPNLTNTIIAITIVYLPRFVILVRASAINEMSKDYVTAAKVAGVGPWRLMFKTVLPNCLAPLIIPMPFWRLPLWAFWGWAHSRQRPNGAPCWPTRATLSPQILGSWHCPALPFSLQSWPST